MRKKKVVVPGLYYNKLYEKERDLLRSINAYQRYPYEFDRENQAYANSLIDAWRDEDARFYESRRGSEELARELEADSIIDTITKPIKPIADVAASAIDSLTGSDIGSAVKNKFESLVPGKKTINRLLDTALNFEDWSRSFISDGAQQTNNFQAMQFEGLQVRGRVLDLHLQRYEDILKRLLNAEQPWAKLTGDALSDEEKQKLRKEAEELGKIILSYHTQYSDNMISELGNYLPDWAANNPITGSLPFVHSEMLDVTRYLAAVGRPEFSIDDQLSGIRSARNALAEKGKWWQEGFESNIADAKAWDKWYHPSQTFLARKNAQNGDINFFDIDTYLYKMPGIIAGTTSSWMKQGSALLTGIMAGKAYMGGNILAGAALTGLTWALNLSSGLDENNIEVAEHYKNKVQKEFLERKTGEAVVTPLGNRLSSNLYQDIIAEGRRKLDNQEMYTDDEVFLAFLAGVYKTENPDAHRIMYDAGKGIESLYQDDMWAVTGDAALETAFEVVPIGKTFSIGKKFTNAWRKAITNPVAKKVIRSKLGSAVVDGLKGTSGAFSRGMAVDPLIGVGNVGVHVLLNPVESKVGNALTKSLFKRFDVLGKTITDTNKLANAYFKAVLGETGAKYVKGIGGRIIKSSITEGIEEGRQNYNARKYTNGEYDSYEIKSLFSSIFDNLAGSVKSAGLIAGMPFGLVPESDRQILNEIKGGIIGGGGHMMTVSVVQNTAPFIREVHADEVLAKTALASKAEKIDFLRKAVLYAKHAHGEKGYAYLMQAFDHLDKANQRYKENNGEWGIDPEDLREERKLVRQIALMYNDPITMRQAESAGIETPQSRKKKRKDIIKNAVTFKPYDKPQNLDQYREFVAFKALARKLYADRIEAAEDSNKELLQIKLQVQQSIYDSTLGDIFSDMNLGASEELESGYNAGTFTPSTLNDHQKLADFENNYTNLLARYAALLEIRSELEQGLKINETNKDVEVKKGLLWYLQHVNKQIDLFRNATNLFLHEHGIVLGGMDLQMLGVDRMTAATSEESIKLPTRKPTDRVNTTEDIQRLVHYGEEHEALKNAYKNYLLRDFDISNAQLALESVTGVAHIQGEDGKLKPTYDPYEISANIKTVEFKRSEIKKLLLKFHKNMRDDDAALQALDTQYHKELTIKRINRENGIAEDGIDTDLIAGEFNSPEYSNTEPFEDTWRKKNRKNLFAPKTAEEELFEKEDAHKQFVSGFKKFWGRDLPQRNIAYNEMQEVANRQGGYNNTTPPPTPPETPAETSQPVTPATPPVPPAPPVIPPAPVQPPVAPPVQPPVLPVTPPVVPPTPPITPPTSNEPFHRNTIQETVLANLERKRKEDEVRVQKDETGYHTTSSDYFIKVGGMVVFPKNGQTPYVRGGKLVRAYRVHSVKPDPYYHQDYVEKRDDNISKLLNSSGNAATLLGEIENLRLKYLEEDPTKEETLKIGLSPYVLYIKDNADTLFLQENKNDLVGTIGGIASELTPRTENISMHMGTAADEVTRKAISDLNNGVDILTQDYLQTSIDTFLTSLEKNRVTYNASDLLTLPAVFSDYLNQIEKVYNYYTQTLHWVLTTSPYKFYNKFAQVGWVAGETDMIGIDEDGDLHIIDFKTTYKSYNTFTVRSPELIALDQKYSDMLSTLTEDDFNRGPKRNGLSKAAREVKRKINESERLNSPEGNRSPNLYTIAWGNTGAHIESKSSLFVQKNTNQYDPAKLNQVVSTFEDYSNQQSIYAEMIRLTDGLSINPESQTTVKSIEILRIGLKYDGVNENKATGTKFSTSFDTRYGRGNIRIMTGTVPNRIMLMFRSLLINYLNSENETDVLNQLAESIRNQIAEPVQQIKQFIEKINALSKEDIDKLSEGLSERIKLFSMKANEEFSSSPDDITALDEYLMSRRDLVDLIPQLQQDIDNELQAVHDLELKRQEEERKRAEEEARRAAEQQPTPPPIPAAALNQQLPSSGHTNIHWRAIDANVKLQEAVSDKRFDIESHIRVYIDNSMLFCDVTFDGVTFSRLPIDTQSDKGRALFNKVKTMQDALQPGQEIVASVTRTAGAIVPAKTPHSILDTDILSGVNIYDLSFDNTGIVGYSENGNLLAPNRAGGLSVIFPGTGQNIANGRYYILKTIQRLPNNVKKPVYLYNKLIGDSDANLIINILLNNKQHASIPIKNTTTGDWIATSMLGKDVISLLIPYYDSPTIFASTASNAYGIVRGGNSTYYITNNPQSIGESYDISTLAGRDAMKSRLTRLSIHADKNILQQRLGDKRSPIFRSLRAVFADDRYDLSEAQFSESLKFSIDDFKVVNTPNGTYSGISALGWFIKNGLFITDYGRMKYPNVEINDVAIDNKVKPKDNVDNDDAVTPPELNAPVVYGEGENEDMMFFRQNRNRYIRLIDKSRVEKNLTRLFGNITGRVVTFDEQLFLDIANTDDVILGACRSDAITLYRMYAEGVEYHEAFHRILEICAEDSVREKLYKQYAEQLGVDLSKDSKENNYEGHRRVAEYLAERYRAYMNDEFDFSSFGKLGEIVAKIFNKIRDFIYFFTSTGEHELYKMFLEANSGYYANRLGTKARRERFKELYGNGLHYEVRGHDFKTIVNDVMYQQLLDTCFYLTVLGQKLNRDGSNIQEAVVNREILLRGINNYQNRPLKPGAEMDYILPQEGKVPTVGQLAMQDIFDNYQYVQDDVANMLGDIGNDYIKKMDEENAENADGGDPVSSSVNDWTKNSYEFNRFDKTTSRVRFFFSTIPDRNQDGTMAHNELGLPLFTSPSYVFNTVLSDLCDIDTYAELERRLERYAKDDPMYDVIYKKVKKVINKAYNRLEGGATDYDAEAFLAQLMGTIRANRHTFMIIRSQRVPRTLKYNLVLLTTDTDYNARNYTVQWSTRFAKGGSVLLKVNKYGAIVFNPDIKNAAGIFKSISNIFESLPALFSEQGSSIQVKVLDHEKSTPEKKLYKTIVLDNIKNSKSQLDILKDKIIESFAWLGIGINKAEFDFMLKRRFGSSDYEAMKLMVEAQGKDGSIKSFTTFLNNITTNGNLNVSEKGIFRLNGKDIPLDNIYSNISYIMELALWKYVYRHSHDTLSVLATNNNKFYEMSDNNLISDVARFINKRSEEFEELLKDPFVYIEGEEDRLGNTPVYGSIIAQQAKNDPSSYIEIKNFVGFKTDKKGDFGADYFEISEQEDYVSKATILENGGIIFPTLSDKKTWVYIDGIRLPGLLFNRRKTENGIVYDNDNLGRQIVLMADGKTLLENMLDLREDVIDQMISYAYSEYYSVLQANEKIDQLEEAGTLLNSVQNYYTLQQGARFSSLLGVYEYTYDNDDNIAGEQYISFNNSKKSRVENLALAEAYFFDRTKEELRMLIAGNLSKRLDKELAYAEKLGLITNNEQEGKYFGYSNVGLNSAAIDAIHASIVNSLSEEEKPKNDAESNRLKSVALVIYINDISNKAIMSGQEVERMFSGAAGFFKWLYNEDGELIDRTVDELKRLGGLASTGTNNFMDLKTVPDKYKDEAGNFTGKYVCAEVDDEMVLSRQFDDIEQMMYDGELYTGAINYHEDLLTTAVDERYAQIYKALRTSLLKLEITDEEYENQLSITKQQHQEDLKEARKEAADKVDNMTVELLEKTIPEEVLPVLKAKAKASTDSFMSIDVNDGQAYVTDVMAEMLLRMVGSYSNEIKEAFDILRGNKPADIHTKSKLYKKILIAVTGVLKYTAFGRRFLDGVNVPYYDKMSIAPIFSTIATGKMANIYSKMKELGIDMLFIQSAVKLGSQGSQKIDWDSYRENSDPTDERNFKNGDVGQQDWKPSFKDGFNFNTYEQKFVYLRKQLNVDPKETDESRVGTQMQKIVMSNLYEGREYTRQDGSVVTGELILNSTMHSIEMLSLLGEETLEEEFYNNDGNVDNKKFCNEVKKMMSSRDGNVNIEKALEVNKDGKQRMRLGATSDGSWLESILISHINKRVIDVHTPGNAYVQRSVWAMEGSHKYEANNGHILSQKDVPQIYGGKPLLMKNKEGSMDCVLTIDFFEHIIPNVPVRKDGEIVYTVDEKGEKKPVMRKMTFDEARKWLIKHNIIGENAKANIVGYRIPTLAQSSIHALRCVDVISTTRDTVILPEEFTKITGSDFDIDKLFLSMLNYKFEKVEKDGETKTTLTDNFFKDGEEKQSRKYYQNLLLKDYLTLLLDNKRSGNLLHRSIDNDTSLLKEVYKKIYGNKLKEIETPYGFYSLSTQASSKNNYITGKIGIGPYALNNNNHILTMLYHVKFTDNKNSIITELGLNRLDRREDYQHNSIMSWISALINVHVDIAKDPFISEMNINQFTYNLSNLLIRTGWGDKTFYFLNLPIMKKMAREYINASSAYMANPHLTKYKIQRDAIESLTDNAFKDVNILGATVKDIRGFADNKKLSSAQQAIVLRLNTLFHDITDTDILLRIAKNDLPIDDLHKITVKDKQLTVLQIQLLCYHAYLQLDPYATSISNLVKYCKIDTKKQGKSFVEQFVFEKGFKKLFNFDPVTRSNIFDIDGLVNLYYDSYVGRKTTRALEATKKLLKSLYVEATAPFMNTVYRILSECGRAETLSVDTVRDVARALSTSIKSQFINEYAKTLSNNPYYMRDLINSSKEYCKFSATKGSNVVTISGDLYHDLRSYVMGGFFTYKVKGPNNTQLVVRIPIIGAEDDKLYLSVKLDWSAKDLDCVLTDGRNTIFDRWNDLSLRFTNDPHYSDILDSSGNPTNRLLRMLIPGRTYDYNQVFDQSERPDTYDHLRFVKLFNGVNDDGIEKNQIINAWDLLLHDNEHPELQQFAKDLVVYSFITSGDQTGFTKMFNYVPYSWREESGYAKEIEEKIDAYNSLDVYSEIHDVDIDDIILNNWYNNNIVPTYYLQNKDKRSTFITVTNVGSGLSTHPIMLAALLKNENGNWEESIDPDNAPRYIKIPRKKYDYDSQRRFTIYQKIGIGRRSVDGGKSVRYPVYVKVLPKGNLLSQNYLVTEYGRSDAYRDVANEYAPNQDVIKSIYQLELKIDNASLEYVALKWDRNYADVLEDMNEEWLVENHIDIFQESPIGISNTTNDNTEVEFYSGAAPGSDTYWAEQSRSMGINVRDYVVDDYDWLSDSQKQSIERQYEQARLFLGKPVLSKDTLKGKLTRRDMMQANSADAIFAIAEKIVKPGEKEMSGGREYTNNTGHDNVSGGTANAVARGIIRNIPVYVYDLSDSQWKRWNDDTNSFEVVEEPSLTKHAAVIGTHVLNENGKSAIRSILNKYNNNVSGGTANVYYWARTSDNNYEVSSAGDKRFSAMTATFNDGTVLFGHDVGGRTIESVYQHGVKQDDWVTDNNNKTGAPNNKNIIKGNTEDDSYYEGYLPLWKEWVKQNPELINELKTVAAGKTLTDKFAKSRVSLARALAEILNQSSLDNIANLNNIEDPTQMTDEERKEAEELKKMCERL